MGGKIDVGKALTGISLFLSEMYFFIDTFLLSFQHPNYKKDSLVTEEITYDLLSTLHRIEKGEIPLCDALKVSSPEQKYMKNTIY